MKYPKKYGRLDNSTTYCSDTVMPYIIIILWIDGWRDASSHFLKMVSRLAENYQSITLTSIAAKIYNALLHNHIEPKIENILRKNQNGFRRNRSTMSQILTIHRILEGVCAKKPKGNHIIYRLYQGLWLRSQKKDGANCTYLQPTKRNRRCHIDAV